MKKEEKIFLNKEDKIEDVELKIKKSKADKIILNIPKHSPLSSSINNFKKIKSIVDDSSKKILIESVDENVLELASLAGFEAYDPIFRKKEVIVADILPRAEKNEIQTEKKQKNFKRKEEEIFEPYQEKSSKDDWNDKKGAIFESKHKSKKRKLLKILSGAALTLVVIFILLTYFLPRLNIAVNFKKNDVNFNVRVLVSPKFSSPTSTPLSTGTIVYLPGQVFSVYGNLNVPFEGKGVEKEIYSKATGTLTLYNYYYLNPQTFVANTRFMSPDGKIFRSLNKIIVPPAKKDKNGNIVDPGIVEVEVIADGVGEEYNIGPSLNWKLPGLKNLPQYDKVYAENKSFMKGGFSGKQFVPEDSDLSEAKKEAYKKLRNNLDSQIYLLNRNQFKIFEDAVFFNPSSQKISSNKDKGFDIFISGSLKEIAFDENHLQKALFDLYNPDKAINWKIEDFKVSYSNRNYNFEKGEMTFEASGSFSYIPDINIAELKKSIVGKKSEEIKEQIFSLPAIDEAKISFWPFWISKAPTNVSSINLEIK